MTSGRGIAHAEETPTDNSHRLNGVQLWVALPEAFRTTDPSFESIERVPILDARGASVQVFSGSLGGTQSLARHYSDVVGADIEIHAEQKIELPLHAAFEHALLLLGGDAETSGRQLLEGQLYYLGTQRPSLDLSTRRGGRLLLIGGPPFPETILMWWNFVARTPEEIARARADWEEHRRFGEVPAYRGPRLSAPSLVRFAPPNPVS
jgi:redox-sensitive bicupin YhaK (pirin superfamily)